ncbi:hypothetical protein I6A84_15345 [Frankia sp. CNm7]|uniref:Uncharacterized protein n=1 Tax=Frankia nepalensis TaxID=1836974 RepID=A0A937RC42_9ACTN|nr:hypothetical protein [Frankia nepalensis]MBL7502377.1 hypothetical protein [Frankia nepalensis]MBL7508429.1 hypothetical protein [Frankia nepalensis]MBL7519441.1 hypothetical protein [Frankia nepalensis]MBL7626260.1 hypothetical protein [Frankia nepalensis]
MTPYNLRFPEYLDGYEAETEAKGYLVDVIVSTGKAEFDLTVYDPVRSVQEISDEVTSGGYFAMANVLVVPAVTRAEVSRAVDSLARVGFCGLNPRLAK